MEISNTEHSKNSLKISLGIIYKSSFCLKVSVKENEVPTEKNFSRTSIFATKASYISN